MASLEERGPGFEALPLSGGNAAPGNIDLLSKIAALLLEGGNPGGGANLELDDCDSKQAVKCASREESLPSKSFVKYDVWQMGHETPSSSLSRVCEFGKMLDVEAVCVGGAERCNSMQVWTCDSFASSLPESVVWQTGHASSCETGAMA